MASLTVGQLIEKLQPLDPKTRVLVDGYEGYYDDPKLDLKPRRYKRWQKGDHWYYGDFEPSGEGRIVAVVIGR